MLRHWRWCGLGFLSRGWRGRRGGLGLLLLLLLISRACFLLWGLEIRDIVAFFREQRDDFSDDDVFGAVRDL